MRQPEIYDSFSGWKSSLQTSNFKDISSMINWRIGNLRAVIEITKVYKPSSQNVILKL